MKLMLSLLWSIGICSVFADEPAPVAAPVPLPPEWVGEDDDAAWEDDYIHDEWSDPYRPYPPGLELELGLLCEDATLVDAPTIDEPVIITGEHAKTYHFPMCDHRWHEPNMAASVYQVEGTGEMFDASAFSGPTGDSGSITVLEGCVEEEMGAGYGMGDEGYYHPPFEMPPWNSSGYANTCVKGHTWEGVRWPTVLGQMYTVIIHTYNSYYSSAEYVFRLSIVDGEGVCDVDSSLEPENLGEVAVDGPGLQIVDFTDDGVYVTDLPTCDYVPDTVSKLYLVTVTDANVLVSAYVEGGNSFVTVYHGDCAEDGYRCLDYMDYPEMEFLDGMEGVDNSNEQQEEAMETMPEPPASDSSSSQEGDVDVEPRQTTLDRRNYNMHSWDNELAGTRYLLAVSTSYGGTSSDFRLTVNATSYGDICTDIVPVDLSTTVTQSLDTAPQRHYKDLFSCYSAGGYYPFHEHDEIILYPGEPLGGKKVAMFTFTGTGEGITATLSGGTEDKYRYYYVHMTLFTADSCSDEMVCVTGDTYSNSLYYETELGLQYYLAVYSPYESMEGAELKIESMTLADPCESATELEVSSTEVTTVQGSSQDAGFLIETSLCNGWADMARAKVYSFTAEADSKMLAKVSAVIGNEQDYYYGYSYIQIAVSTGECGSAECPSGYNSYYADRALGASWTATAGVTYYITIYSTDLTTPGEFVLTLEPQPTTSICDGEDVVDLGSLPEGGLVLDGSTVSSPFYSDLYKCDERWEHMKEFLEDMPPEELEDMLRHRQQEMQISSRAAVYTFSGDGKSYLLGLNDVYEFNGEVSVFSGACTALDCQLTGHSYDNHLVETEAGEVYTVVVSDCCNDNGKGSFKLSIVETAFGDLENNATALDMPSSELRLKGTMADGLYYSDLINCNYGSDSPAVVYKLEAGPGRYVAKVTAFDFDVRMSVVAASPYYDGYECVGQHNWREVSWSGVDSPVYVAVQGSGATGDYVLRVEQLSETETDMCTAVEAVGDDPVLGSTAGGAIPMFYDEHEEYEQDYNRYNNYYGDYHEGYYGGQCNYGNHYYYGGYDCPTVAYTVQGTGGYLEASIYVENGDCGDAALTVMGGDCDSLMCLPEAFSASNGYYMPRSLTFASNEDETYHVLVTSCCRVSSGADFVLKVEESDGTSENGWPHESHPADGSGNSDFGLGGGASSSAGDNARAEDEEAEETKTAIGADDPPADNAGGAAEETEVVDSATEDTTEPDDTSTTDGEGEETQPDDSAADGATEDTLETDPDAVEAAPESSARGQFVGSIGILLWMALFL